MNIPLKIKANPFKQLKCENRIKEDNNSTKKKKKTWSYNSDIFQNESLCVCAHIYMFMFAYFVHTSYTSN